MTLEEIISAAVDKRIREIVAESFNDSGFDHVHHPIRKRIDEMFQEEWEKRNPSIREEIGKQLDGYEITKIEATIYAKLETRKIKGTEA